MVEDGKIRHYISFDGVSTYDYACYCDGAETFGAPEREYESVSIPGRNGELKFDKGHYKDVTLKYPIFFEDIKEFEDFKNRITSKTGVRRLDDSHHPDEYRLATLTGELAPKVAGYDNEYCSCDVSFTAKPQRFLYSGEQEQRIQSSRILYNPTQFAAKPLVRVSGSGAITINDITIGYACASGYNYMIIDCENQDAYYVTSTVINANGDITLENDRFFELLPGNNLITTDKEIYITPRWWCL